MGQARDKIDAIAGVVRNAARNGMLTTDQVGAVNRILGSGARAKEQLAQLTRLVTDAEQSGMVRATVAAPFWAIVGRQGAAPTAAPVVHPRDREVTVRLRVTGERVRASVVDVNRQVEQVLAGAARQAGLTVVAGSVNVANA